MKYLRPRNLAEFFTLIGKTDSLDYSILSGGTDVIPAGQFKSLPARLIDIKEIADLKGIREFADRIEIGALTTISDLMHSDLISREYTALWQSTREFAGVQIRNRATIGGNICNASPAGDTLPSLYAFSAGLKLVGPDTERELPIGDFIVGPGKTDLRPGELLQSIILPRNPGKSRFVKLGLRQSMAIAVVNYALVYRVEDHQFTQLMVAAGAVAPTVKTLTAFTKAFRPGVSLDAAVDLIDQDIAPQTDIRASAAYRSQVLKNLLAHDCREILETNAGNNVR